MIAINNTYHVDWQKCLNECNEDYNLFFELIEDEKLDIERYYDKLEQEHCKPIGFYQAVSTFKDTLYGMVKTNIEYYRDPNPMWVKIQNLLSNEGKMDVEKSKEIPIEHVCELLGIKINRGRGSTPFIQDATNNTAFRIKNNRFKCYRTDKYGTNIDLVMEVLGKNFVEAVKFLNNQT